MALLVGPSVNSAGGCLQVGYYAGGGVALSVYSGQGKEYTATVNLVDHPLPEGEVWLKGWPENEGVPEALEAAGVVELTGRRQITGHAEAQHALLLIDVEMEPGLSEPQREREEQARRFEKRFFPGAILE